MESVAESQPKSEESVSTATEIEREKSDGPDTGSEPAESIDPEQKPEADVVPDDGFKQKTEADVVPDDSSEQETEADAVPEENLDVVESAESSLRMLSVTEQMVSVTVLEAEQIAKSAVTAIPEDTVSTGSELTAWLERHKNTGGAVKLADHVILEENYSFFPNRADGPSLFVDTDQYTITVTGEMELASDDHLTFAGRPDGKSIFYVAPKGILSMQGVTVESEEGALWQEEGAGLVLSDCSVSGDVHYADTPFVMYGRDSICAVVEKGQTINDVLPMQLSCTVNRRGRLYHNERISVSWDQTESEAQQEKRQRFVLQGAFLNAASAEPALCTIVYNDYPLTFTDVEASANGCLYTFQGGFTAPEESLPFTVMAEYSFDGENWFLYEEQKATNTNAGFYIVCKSEPIGRMADSNIYIRLQWNDNGTRYFSNVLCYAVDTLEIVDDIGGSRGGGTSITNPPDEPKESTDSAVSEENAGGAGNQSASVDDVGAGNQSASVDDVGAENDSASLDDVGAENHSAFPDGAASENNGSQSEVGNLGQAPTDGEPAAVKPANVGVEPAANAGMENANTEPVINAGADAGPEPANTDAGRPVSIKKSNTGTELALRTEAKPEDKSRILREDPRRNYILIVAGIVGLSAVAGMAGFYLHFRSGTNR